MVDQTQPTVSDLPKAHPFAGYKVMVNGCEVEMIYLDRNELIRQLAFCIDRVEAMELLCEQLNIEFRGFRTGKAPT
jgi:hypothetical protein